MTENNYLIVDENGVPSGSADLDQIQTAATILGFDLAAASDCPADVDRLLEAALAEHGPKGIGYVLGAALRHVVVNVLAPVLEVTDELHKVGALSHDLRDGLADAAFNAREALR